MDLLEMAVEQHGGRRRWGEISRVHAAASFGGDVWKSHQQDGLLDDVVLTGETRDQRLTITPFPGPGRYATWEPYGQFIKTDDGVPVARSRRIELQAAGLAALTGWSLLTMPFLLTRPDFVTEETGSWREDGEVWQRLSVTYPACVAAHCARQTYYFDNSGLLCRTDFTIDRLGGEPLVLYAFDYCECDGILVPMRHRGYARTADGTPDLSTTVLEVTLHDVVYS
jgi:hypothetical protein